MEKKLQKLQNMLENRKGKKKLNLTLYKVQAVAANLFLLVSSWADVEVAQSNYPRQAVLMLHLVVAEGVSLQGVAVVLWVGEHVNLEGLADEVVVAVNKGIKV